MIDILYALLLIAATTLLFTGSAGFIYIIIDSIKQNKELKKHESNQNTSRY